MRRLALPIVVLCGCACGVVRVDPVENGKGSLDFTLLLNMRSLIVTASTEVVVVLCDTELADRVDLLSVTVAERVLSRYGVGAILLMTLALVVIDILDNVIFKCLAILQTEGFWGLYTRGILDAEEEILPLLKERSKPASVAWLSITL